MAGHKTDNGVFSAGRNLEAREIPDPVDVEIGSVEEPQRFVGDAPERDELRPPFLWMGPLHHDRRFAWLMPLKARGEPPDLLIP